MSAINWQKSSFSSMDGNTNCVELATGAVGTLHLRESDHPNQVLTPPRQAIRSLLTRIKAGDLDRLTA